MGTYSTSDTTKMALIMAAGELFADHGVAAVSLRDIAKKAGENIGNVHYHFGGKKGLVDAVIDYAIEPCCNDPYGKYLQEHEALFATRETQCLLVCGMIDCFFKMIFIEGRPQWCGIMVLKLLQQDMSPTKKIFDLVAVPFSNAFFSLYHKISGDNDVGNALAWTVSVTSAARILSRDSSIVKKMNPSDDKFNSIKNKLLLMTMRGALININLKDDTDNVINQYLESKQLTQ